MNRQKPTFQHNTHPLYSTWCNIKQRCYNPKNTSYDLYGGRGVTMCERWRNSFEAFCEDVGDRPSLNHTIDRYPDKNGNYSPDNFRWATKKEQNLNRNKPNRKVLHFKQPSECARMIDGQVFNWYFDFTSDEEQNKQVFWTAKEKFHAVRKLKHKRGHYQLFVK